MQNGISPKLSIIIVNWNVELLLRQCIDSIYNGYFKDFEIIVVDNNSCDNSCEVCHTCFPGVIVVKNTENLGFAKANNIAIAKSRGEYVLLLNPDTIVAPDALGKMVSFLDSAPEAGVAGPKVLEKDGCLQGSARQFPSMKTAFFGRTTMLQAFLGKSSAAKDEIPCLTYTDTAPLEVDWVSGACLLIRKKAVNKIGPLDEKFFMYWEDADWCFQTKKAGWKVFWLPDAQIVHLTGESSDKSKPMTIKQFHKSIYYYYRKNINPRPASIVALIVRSLITTRCFIKLAQNSIKR